MQNQWYPRMLWAGLLCAVISILSGCTREPERSSTGTPQSLAGTPDQPPENPASTLAQLQRYLGQSEFISIARQQGIWQEAEAEAPAAEDQGSPSPKRDIQEADLFKLGPAGSSLLYLLNPYRGLQVIDFSRGASSPNLLGRAPATGHEVIEMHFDAEHLQIIVLERGWDGQSGYGALDRVLLYSVKDPSRPRIIQTIELNGSLADSRIVGSVLYVATSRWSYFADGSQPVGEGHVNSFRILDGGLSPVASRQLSLPVSALKNMNIVSASEAGQPRYYLISVLAENRFSWIDRKSTVEVLDISDPEGSIQPLLMASVAGEIRERSSTAIKDGTLITVSNSFVDRGDGEQTLRVSVESFKLPTAESADAAIDRTEAEFRRLWFEREMQKRPSGEDATDYASKLQTHPEYGLKGVFVRQPSGGFAKILPDQTITVGDDSGQHADLQDVRFTGDKLYVFWVPANQIDPLDVFDIAAPATNLRYLGRTLFEGWIERAIPLQYQGRDFILGLGWIVPPTEAAGRQVPLAVLFGAEGATYKPLAQLSLADDELWSYFNDEDKQILVNSQDNGKGTIMFPATTSREGRSRSGGKVLTYDLAASEAGGYLSEGPLYAADASWIRRVFENPELNKVHTLTDRSLGTYDPPSAGFNAASQVIEAASTLELARDIVAYTEVKIGAKRYGVQIINKDDGSGIDLQTAVRLVDPERADSELKDTSLARELKGRYETHLMSEDGSLILLTSRDLELAPEAYNTWSQELRLTRLTWTSQGSLSISGLAQSLVWKESGTYPRSKIYPGAFTPYTLKQLGGGEILLLRDRQLRFFTSTNKLSFTPTQDSLACLPENAADIRLHQLAGTDYLSYALPYVSDEAAYAKIEFERHYMAPLRARALVCAESLNIPGRPLAIKEGKLITDEERFLGFEASELVSEEAEVETETIPVRRLVSNLFRETQLWPQTSRVLHALELKDGQATLRDIYGLEGLRSAIIDEPQGVFMLEQPQSWGVRYLAGLTLTRDARFVKKSLLLPLHTAPTEDVRLLKVLRDAKGESYFLMQAQQRGYVLHEKPESKLLQALPLRILGEESSGAGTRLDFPVYSWFESEARLSERLVFEPEARRLTLAEGLWGIVQVDILREELPR